MSYGTQGLEIVALPLSRVSGFALFRCPTWMSVAGSQRATLMEIEEMSRGDDVVYKVEWGTHRVPNIRIRSSVCITGVICYASFRDRLGIERL